MNRTPEPPPFQALTAYGVPILSVYLACRKSALWWAEREGYRYGAHCIVQRIKNGQRVIWKAAA